MEDFKTAASNENLMEKITKKSKNKVKRKTSEKPISLAGAKFEDVLKALLETKPKPNDKRGGQDV